MDWIDLCYRVEQEYLERTRRSRELWGTAQSFLPGGDTRTTTYYSPYPVTVVEGSGCTLKDVDGNTYVDFLNNYTALVLGHGHPDVTRAVAKRLQAGHAFAAFQTEQLELARTLVGRIRTFETVRFTNSGTEAAMLAVRLARAYTRRSKIVKMIGGYHGTNGSVYVSVKHAGNSDGFGYPRELTDLTLSVPYNDAKTFHELMSRSGSEIAMVIVEPMLGAGGAIPGDAGFLQELVAGTREHGALLVFDEVQTFRLGYGGLQERLGIVPDLTILGKVIGGGLPVGAVGGRRDVLDLTNPASQTRISCGGTFNGNGATMTGGIATLDVLTRDEVERLNGLGDHLRAALIQVLASAGIHGTVTGCGSILQLHLGRRDVRRFVEKSVSQQALEHLMHLSLINRGVWSAARGSFNLSTPMGESHVKRLVDAIAEVLTEIRPVLVTRWPEYAA